MLTVETVGAILERQGLLTGEQRGRLEREARSLPAAYRNPRTSDQRALAYELIERLRFPCADSASGYLGEHEVAQAIARDAELPYVRIDPLTLNADLMESKMSRPFAKRQRMLPLDVENGRLRVVCADPYDHEAIDSFRRITGRELEILVASEPEILRSINEFYGLRHAVRRAEADLTQGVDLGNLEALVRLKSDSELEASDQHVVNAVEFMLQHAYDTRASDIHIEPKRSMSVIRFRIDGVLHDIQSIPKVVHDAVVSRIKTMARLDIAERRRPQDGRVKTQRAGQEVELRVSSLPVAFGEKLVLRIFDPQVLMQDLEALGFFPDELATFRDFIARPYGIVLVTGPTGSGKTTTLYSALKTIFDREINLVTIEDPIEMVYEDFNQTAVNVKAGVTFASALRHVLRQDPDVIMIGEIRDAETAQYAIQAALTGHLVFSTLHTNDAPSAVTRLHDLGLERFLVNSTLVGVVAQRLVRKVCRHCAVRRKLTAEEIEMLRLGDAPDYPGNVREGTGCSECRGTGYFGRTAIFEILALDAGLKQSIDDGADASTLRRQAIAGGMRTLRQSALRRMAEGTTTPAEVVRVTGV